MHGHGTLFYTGIRRHCMTSACSILCMHIAKLVALDIMQYCACSWMHIRNSYYNVVAGWTSSGNRGLPHHAGMQCTCNAALPMTTNLIICMHATISPTSRILILETMQYCQDLFIYSAPSSNAKATYIPDSNKQL